jgi:hypothetical protein
MLSLKIIAVVKGSPKIKQTPPKQIKIPKMTNLVICSPLKILINKIDSGTIAGIIETKPLVIYFTSHVLRPLLKEKLIILSMIMIFLWDNAFFSKESNTGKEIQQ